MSFDRFKNRRRFVKFLAFAMVVGVPARAFAALGDERYVGFRAETGSFPLVAAGKGAPLLVDSQDHAGVRRAVDNLRSDLAHVTGLAPEVAADGKSSHGLAVIVGTIGRNRVIDRLIAEGKIDAAPVAGKWEAFLRQVVEAPWPGLERALVIAGSDKRGTIYGIYDLSEQIGVSPWEWWADVPVAKHPELFVIPGRHVEASPVVKYRGIFLNDEAPALSGWAREKFGGFNHVFYEHVFELLLRLRGNYLWPAMWNNAFNEDDPDNARLADEYGVVMGTSHHEPMLRAQQEWKRHGTGPWDYAKNAGVLRSFWADGVRRNRNYESIVTLAMRGDGDEPMSEEANVALLERIVADQRKILAAEVNPDVTRLPQLWALYKEVQGYYEKGMRVPDDVTLLWCDDNWGNIRRLPTPTERTRTGGAGVYYHFDYVGGPRNYKWLNTIPLTKISEQMNLAWQYDANRIWIVNVGDLKPMEFPIEFFLRFAWNPARWPYEKLGEYSRAWAEREFGPEHAKEIAALVNGYTKLNGRRKPEMLAPDTWSLVNYREADRVLAEWRDLVVRAERVNDSLPAEARSAFFQLVLYPAKASANAQELYVAAGLNRLYAKQGRTAANTMAARVRECFAEDGRLVAAYHALGGGKWNHMMDQVKFGYTTWQQPETETMPAVSEVRPHEGAAMAVAIEGSETAWPSYNAGAAVLPPLDSPARGTRWIEIFNRGRDAFTYKATSNQPWLKISPASGSVEEIARLEIGVDWSLLPPGESTATISLASVAGERFTVCLPVQNRPVDATQAGCFIESDHHLAIEAPHFARAVADAEIEWHTLPDFGRTLGGVTAFPVTAAPRQPGGVSPHLEYDVQLFTTGEVTVELQCAPSLDFQSGDGLRLAVSFDGAPPQIVKLDTQSTQQTWEHAVGDGARRVTTKHRIDQPGRHVLKFWFVTPGIVLERLVIDAGGVRPSYLGPPENPRMKTDSGR